MPTHESRPCHAATRPAAIALTIRPADRVSDGTRARSRTLTLHRPAHVGAIHRPTGGQPSNRPSRNDGSKLAGSSAVSSARRSHRLTSCPTAAPSCLRSTSATDRRCGSRCSAVPPGSMRERTSRPRRHQRGGNGTLPTAAHFSTSTRPACVRRADWRRSSSPVNSPHRRVTKPPAPSKLNPTS